MPYRLIIVSACAPGVIKSRHSSEAQKMAETDFPRSHLGDNLGVNPECEVKVRV